MRKVLFTGCLALFVATTASAEELRVIGFNVESGGASPYTIQDQMQELGAADIWGFSEVEKFWWALRFKETAEEMTGDDYYFDWGSTGGGDRLVLLYNTTKLERVGDHEELHQMNPWGSVRSPLVTRLRHKASGTELLAMVNHLYRGRADRRRQQAKWLNEWGAAQGDTAIIAMGDYNFDWDLSGTSRDEGYDLMVKDGVFDWIEPDPLVKSQCSPDYNSILDFVFVAGDAQDWSAESDVLFPEPDYCSETNLRSDHRPVEAVFRLPGEPAVATQPTADTAAAIAGIRASIAEIEATLASMKAQLEALENP